MADVSRGAVVWLEMEAEGRHPVCVLTRNEAIPRLDNVVVATISSRTWGLQSEVPLGPEDGVPRECAISLDKLGSQKMDEVCRAIDYPAGC